MDIFNMFEREKILLVSLIKFAGRNGLDEFLLAMNYKVTTGRKDCCLSEQEMINVLRRVGMWDIMIEDILNKIKKGDIN